MRDGIYQVTFTTNNGTLGAGVCLFRGDRYVGADFLHSYCGTVTQEGNALKVSMQARRQPGAVTEMDLPLEFELHQTGEENAAGFALTAQLPGGVVMVSTGLRVHD